eukprot:scaffold19149_cov146-Isochrysis_galbana.AAC.1
MQAGRAVGASAERDHRSHAPETCQHSLARSRRRPRSWPLAASLLSAPQDVGAVLGPARIAVEAAAAESPPWMMKLRAVRAKVWTAALRAAPRLRHQSSRRAPTCGYVRESRCSITEEIKQAPPCLGGHRRS